MLSAMTLDQLGAKMKCDRCGKRPERYYPANESDTPGFVRSFYVLVACLRRALPKAEQDAGSR